MTLDRVRRGMLGLSVLLWIVSLFFPAFSPDWPGWSLVLFGWMSYQSPWLANPMVVLSWIAIAMRFGTFACTMAIPAFLLAGYFHSWDSVIAGTGPSLVIEKLYLGYWLWLSSTIAALISASATVGQRRASRDRE